MKEVADRVALENLGAPSVFAVAEAVKEWLVDNNIAGQDGSMYSGKQTILPFCNIARLIGIFDCFGQK